MLIHDFRRFSEKSRPSFYCRELINRPKSQGTVWERVSFCFKQFDILLWLVYSFFGTVWGLFCRINKLPIHKGVCKTHTPFRFIISIPLFLFLLPVYAEALTVSCQVLHRNNYFKQMQSNAVIMRIFELFIKIKKT